VRGQRPFDALIGSGDLDQSSRQTLSTLLYDKGNSVLAAFAHITRKLCYRKDDRAMRPIYE